MSTRRGTWVINRMGPNGWPVDMVLSTPVHSLIQRFFPSLINWYAERDMNSHFNHELYSLKPKHRPFG